jgi:hypothetical protein
MNGRDTFPHRFFVHQFAVLVHSQKTRRKKTAATNELRGAIRGRDGVGVQLFN